MSSTVKIYIKGLAACVYNGSEWEIGFVCDETHNLIFRNVQLNQSMSLKEASGISVAAAAAVAPSKPHATAAEDVLDLARVFNLTADYAHDRGIRRRPKPAYGQAARKIVVMKLANAFLYSGEPTDKRYVSVEYQDGKPTGRKKNVGYVVDEVIALVVFEDEGQIQLLTPGMDGETEQNFSVADGSLLTLEFNNNCETGKCDRNSDFHLYYELIEDADTPGRRFEVEIDENSGPFTNRKGLVVAGRVNCYPVIIGESATLL